MSCGLVSWWYKFRNCYFRWELGKPLTFLCGSEEELRRVTTWICHVRPNIFNNGNPVMVCYFSQTEKEEGCGAITGVRDKHGLVYFDGVPTIEHEFSFKWCSYVFRYNIFEGTQYVVECPYFFSPRRFVEKQLFIKFEVYHPSAHERAESLLALLEWLDGKVSEQEKRELLQLPDDVEV